MYVVRLGGFKSTKITSSKPCVRCASQLKLLGFKKIHYIDEEKKECCRLKMNEDTQISWGLKNVRKKTLQVARTYASSRCLSYCSGESSDESETDDE